MAQRRATFSQADVARVLRGAAAAGVAVSRVEIDPTGKIVAVLGEPMSVAGGNEWDTVLPDAEAQRIADKRH